MRDLILTIVDWTVLIAAILGGGYYLNKRSGPIMSFFKNPFGTTEQTPKRLPTPDETKQAITQLKLAASTIDDALHTKGDQLSVLAIGAKALALSLRLDPAAQYTYTDGATYTHDVLAGQLLYIESKANFDGGVAALNNWDIEVTDPQQGKNITALRQAAINAAEKAVEYQPNNVIYLNHLALMYWKGKKGRHEKAEALLKRVLKIDPDNLDALKQRHR